MRFHKLLFPMKKITIELSEESATAAAEYLKAHKKQVDPKLKEVCKRLAEIGASEASARFARGDHGNGGVSVSVEPIENGYKIVASGQDVYFIEFGTGVFAGIAYGDSGVPAVSVPVYPGSYSEQNKRRFSEYGFWYYKGERLEGTEAEMPMYYAGRAIRMNEKRIAQEVFGK